MTEMNEIQRLIFEASGAVKVGNFPSSPLSKKNHILFTIAGSTGSTFVAVEEDGSIFYTNNNYSNNQSKIDELISVSNKLKGLKNFI